MKAVIIVSVAMDKLNRETPQTYTKHQYAVPSLKIRTFIEPGHPASAEAIESILCGSPSGFRTTTYTQF